MTCWTRYCIYRSREEQIPKSLRQNDAHNNSRDRVVQLCPPARPYIKKSFEGILMYELAGDYINKYCNYADPSNILRKRNVVDTIIRVRVVEKFIYKTSCYLIH